MERDAADDVTEGWAGDWRTIWESELAALAVDREAHEAVSRAAAGWPADAAPRTDAPPRTPAAAAAPGIGDAAGMADLVEQLERRVADLRGQGRDWAAVAAELGGTAEARRKQLARALDRVAAELGLDDGDLGA